MTQVQIVNMARLDEVQMAQAAQILTDSIPLGWPSLQDAVNEIEERLIPGNTLLAAVEDSKVLGWGGILAPTYGGNVFELHPLVCSDRRAGHWQGAVVTPRARSQKPGGLRYIGIRRESGAMATSRRRRSQARPAGDSQLRSRHPSIRLLHEAGIPINESARREWAGTARHLPRQTPMMRGGFRRIW